MMSKGFSMRRWFKWLAKSRPNPVSEETIFANDVARLDKEQPGWDHDAKVASAESALANCGFSREFAVKIYGEEIIREAEANILKKQRRNS